MYYYKLEDKFIYNVKYFKYGIIKKKVGKSYANRNKKDKPRRGRRKN